MWQFKQIPTTRRWLFGYATAGVLVGMVSLQCFTEPQPMNESEPTAPLETQAFDEITVVSPVAVRLASKELDWAEHQAEDRLEQHFKPVDELFEAVRCREFAEHALGWESKWLLLKSNFVNSGEHEKMIERAFKLYIFDEAELARLLQQCTHAYIRDIDSVDSELLVRLSLDLANLPEGEIPVFDAHALKLCYADALGQAVTASRADVMATVKRETVSFIVSEVLTQALVQLGVSAGVLAAGGASGWATFGAGIVVGILVDYAIQQYSDPISQLAEDLQEQLALLHLTVLQGGFRGMGGESPPDGLMQRLRYFAVERSTARRIAVERLLSEFATRRELVPVSY